jgi:hypothetical protein
LFDTDCLQYLHEHGAACGDDALLVAASNIHNTKCFRYLVDAGCALDYALACAAMRSNSAALLYALEKGCTGCLPSATYAARCGSLVCMKYVHEHGGSWDAGTCAMAARESGEATGQAFACLRYAHEHGCPWDEETCAYAACSGNLECLQYAHEHGCPWDETTCRYASQNSNTACLQYAHEHGCPWSAAAIVSAVRCGSIACLTYLHEHGCPWPAPAEYLSLTKNIRNRKCFEYMAEHPEQRPAVVPVPPADYAGCACTSAGMHHAAVVAEPIPAVAVTQQSVPSEAAADDDSCRSWADTGK